MPTLEEMKNIANAGHELVKASREAYPNASDQALEIVCATAVVMALEKEAALSVRQIHGA